MTPGEAIQRQQKNPATGAGCFGCGGALDEIVMNWMIAWEIPATITA